MQIESLVASEIDAFARYLNLHLKENGSAETGYFQPMSVDASVFTQARAAAFERALAIPTGSPGWRRAWVARDASGEICGHIDLRAHPEAHTAHRCLLGMGLHAVHRGSGLASQLFKAASSWAVRDTDIEAIDLQVLSGNARAIRFYQNAGFNLHGVLPDFFRIDGRSMSWTWMSCCLVR